MKSLRSDRWTIGLLLLALALQVAWLLYDMGLIEIGSPNSSGGQQEYAGQISRAENKLKRRALNSLVWDESRIDDAIYYYDSLLTLSQSTAQIALTGGGEILLSENTLVTIEPPENNRQGEIRLKFIKGSMEARNTYANAHIKNKTFAIDLQKGSSLELTQVGENDFDVRLKGGEGEIFSELGRQKLASDKIFKVQGEQVAVVDVDQSLKWRKPPPRRVYTHKAQATVTLSWQGQADELQIKNEKQNVAPLKNIAENSERKIKLPLGNSRLYLVKDSNFSEPLDIQVWQAPQFHLLRPLPRDRSAFGEIKFMWTPVTEAAGYYLRLRSGDQVKDIPSPKNTMVQSFSTDQDYQWSVWVKDKEGFMMPPPYSYPLHIRENPFSAPKVVPPSKRVPSEQEPSPSTSLWSWLLPNAFADDQVQYEGQMAWQAMDGADHYVVEIAQSADFRSLLASRKVTSSQLVWKNIKVGDKLFWRVAAGHSSGRLGVFSEPMLMEIVPVVMAKPPAPTPTQVSAEPAKESTPAPQMAKPTTSKRQAKPQPSPPAVSKDKAPSPVVVKKTVKPQGQLPPPKSRFLRLFWRGGYGFASSKNQQRVTTEFAGEKMLSFAGEYEFQTTAGHWWQVAGEFTSTEFTPASTAVLPFQENLTLSQGELRITSGSELLRYGGLIRMFPNISRQGVGRVQKQESFAAGVMLESLSKWDRLHSRTYLGPLVASEYYGALVSQRVTYYLFTSVQLGFELEVEALFGDHRQIINSDGFLIIGAEF